jgi:hypothetical protein
LSGLTNPDASAAELHERIVPTLRTLRSGRHRELLEAVSSSSIVGAAKTLDALQQGRVETIVATWPLDDREVFEHQPTGFIATAIDQARLGGGEPPRRLELGAAIQILAERHGASVEFVNGTAREVMREQFAELAGLARW